MIALLTLGVAGAAPATPGRDKKMNQVVKIVFDDPITQDDIKEFIGSLYSLLSFFKLTAVSFITEEEFNEEPEAKDE